MAASQASKPLPPLPRGWSRVCHETGIFLRGIGLGIVMTFFQGIFTKNFLEPEKVAIRRSRTTALLRTLIHVVPVGVALFEIILNLKGHFVGKSFDKQNYLQFAAKAHEIAMQASIATILLSYIRYQISAGKGIPFGAVLSGLQFLQVSYLWSVELWSSILSKDFQPRKKSCFAGLILICITVAATAGPSSASLLIARQGLWPTASTYFAVNASVSDLWPDRLDDQKVNRSCAVARLDSHQYAPGCPISELYHLLLEDSVYRSLFHATDDMLLRILIRVPETDFNMDLLASTCLLSSTDQYCATAPQTEFMKGFYFVQSSHYFQVTDLDLYQFMQKNYYQPYTVASCVTDAANASDQAPLRFARISETESENQRDREIVSIPGLTKDQIIDEVSGDNFDFRVIWIDLPMDVFNTGIPGAVIVNSQGPNGSSYDLITCTLNAGWGSSTLMRMSQEPGEIFSRMSNIPSSGTNHKSKIDGYGYVYTTAPSFANISNFSYPQRRISVSKNWMEFLNPAVVLPDNSTDNYISLALRARSSETPQPIENNLAQLLNVLLATALANAERGSDWQVFSDLKNATRTCDTCLIFEIENWKFGWLYSARGTTIRLALTLMLAYCTLVLGHIIYSAISGVSSTAWDSTAELVALAMNSSPPQILQNTCAGIVGRQALKTSVRVLATTPGHLELVFGEVKDPNAQTSELVMNEKYGKLMDEDGNENEERESNAQGTLRKRAVAQSSD